MRVLGALEVPRRPVRELTGLYERAKFSQHPVDEPMRERAIAALIRIRDELRELAERAPLDAGATPPPTEQAAPS